MQQLILHPTSMAQWHSLVCDAENAAHIYLDDELQSYLVFLLMRFLEKPDLAARILALEYIESLLSQGTRKLDKLRDVGDICLIHAGLFPERARRKRVSKQYFIDLGCGAYRQLSTALEHQDAHLYRRLSSSFIALQSLLSTMQNLGELVASDASRPALTHDTHSNAGSMLFDPPQQTVLKH